MAYNWIYNTSNDNIYILILIIVILGLIIINFKLWSRKIDRFYNVGVAKWINKGTGADASMIVVPQMYNLSSTQQYSSLTKSFTNNETITINSVNYTYVSPSNYGPINEIVDPNNPSFISNPINSTYIYVIQTSTETTTTQAPGMWINLDTGNQFNVTQTFYNNSLIQAPTKTSTITGNIPILGISYKTITPSPFGPNNSIFDTATFNTTSGANPDDPKFIYVYVTLNQPTTTSNQPTTPTTTSTQLQTSTRPQTTSNQPTTPTTTSTQLQTSIQPSTTSNQPTTTSNQPTTTKATGTWISLTGNPVNVTQEIYNMSITQGLNNYYNKINTGSILINDINYNYLSPSPFRYGNNNYNIIKDVVAFNNNQTSNPNDPNYIYIYVNLPSNTQITMPQTTMSQSSNTQTTMPQTTIPQSSNTQTTMPQTSNTQTTMSQSSNTQSSNSQTSTKPQTTLISTSSTQQQCIPLPLCLQPPTQPQTTTYNNPLNPNFYISKEEEARRNAWSQLDGDEESLHNTNGSNTTYQNDILYNPNNGGLLNNGSNQQNLALIYSTIGDYATLDSLGAKLTDTIGGINSNLGYTVLDEQLGTFNNYSNTIPNAPNHNTYDNTANYNTGMNPYTVNGVSSGTVSAVGNGTSGKYTQDNKPIFMQKDFEGVSNIFAPNIYISNPPLTEDGNPDISFQM